MSNSIDTAHKPPAFPANEWSNFVKSIFIGSSSGVAATIFIQPMIYGKNRVQRGETLGTKNVTKVLIMQCIKEIRAMGGFRQMASSFYTHVATVYSGGKCFALSFAPTIAIQTAAKNFFSQMMDPLYASASAGAISSFIVCPAECIMTQQQITKKSFLATFKQMGMASCFRALFETAMRESIFTGAYLGVAPKIKSEMQARRVNEALAFFFSGAIAGITAAGISQAFDTIKTRKQSDFTYKPSLVDFFRRSAFAGFKWRCLMIVTATNVMAFTQEKLNNFLK